MVGTPDPSGRADDPPFLTVEGDNNLTSAADGNTATATVVSDGQSNSCS